MMSVAEKADFVVKGTFPENSPIFHFTIWRRAPNAENAHQFRIDQDVVFNLALSAFSSQQKKLNHLVVYTRTLWLGMKIGEYMLEKGLFGGRDGCASVTNKRIESKEFQSVTFVALFDNEERVAVAGDLFILYFDPWALDVAEKAGTIMVTNMLNVAMDNCASSMHKYKAKCLIVATEEPKKEVETPEDGEYYRTKEGVAKLKRRKFLRGLKDSFEDGMKALVERHRRIKEEYDRQETKAARKTSGFIPHF